ncbi:MAG: hypothetical protein M3032_05200 [Verrucomicrobiota bacterium]|nr:hypothetical protein [Verrucomicrobiota bacterium]
MPSVSAEFHRFHDKARPVVGTCLYGWVASLAAVAFQLSINCFTVSFYDEVLLQDGHDSSI